MKNINLGQERRGAYAIYTTWGCAGSEENGLADVSEKLWTFLSDIVLQVLSFVAENERTNIKQRQAEGIAVAKAKGVKFGRPPLPLPDNFYEVHRAWRSKKLTLKEAANACNIPVGTFYGKARKFENTA